MFSVVFSLLLSVMGIVPAGAADTVAPSRPNGVWANASPTGLRVTWSPSGDDVGVVGYLVHRDGQFVAWVPSGATYNDLAVAVGSTYRYEIRAQDAARNVSPPSIALLATFDPSVDRIAPSAPNGLRLGTIGAGVWMSWPEAFDNRSVRGYLVYRDGQFQMWLPAGASGTGAPSAWTDTRVVGGRSHRYEIRAQDAAGNTSAPSDPVTITAPGGTVDPPLDGLPGLLVTSTGNDATADGTPRRPYRTLTAAARVAPAGATIFLSNGVHRESIDLDRKSLKIRAVPGAAPVLSGADRITAWTQVGGRWWAQGPNFPDTGWPTGLTSSARSALVDIVVVDGTQLRQVTTSAELDRSSFWIDVTNRVWLGRDPGPSVVEIATRTRGILARNVDGFLVEGLTFRHYASGPGDAGAVELWGANNVIRSVLAHDNASAGIRVIGRSVLIEGTRAVRNGRVGAIVHQSDDAIVRSSVFNDNNTEDFAVFGAAGGVKMTASRNVRIVGNEVLDNFGHGIWFDLSSLGIVIDANHTARNSEAGILVEVSAFATVSRNVAVDNGRGIYIVESNDVRVTGNTVGLNQRNILVLDGHREGNGCVDREAGAIHVPPIDTRFGCQWPTLRWDIQNLAISGNLIVGGRPGSTQFAMVEINHVARPEGDIEGLDRRRTAEQMGVVIGANYFERRAAGVPRWVVGWSQWPTSMAAYEDLASFMASTGQGAGSVYVAR